MKKAKYRVKPIFGSNTTTTYVKHYVLEKKWLGIWFTISQTTIDKEMIMKDCEEAEELYNKYNDVQK